MAWALAVVLAGIVASMGAAMFFMLRRGGAQNPEAKEGVAAQDARRSRAMLRALALRVFLSVLVFACVLLAAWMGWIQPSAWGARL